MNIQKYKDFLEEDFSLLFENKSELESYKDIMNRIVEDVGLNFGFVFTFGTSITAFFPIVESLIRNSGVEVTKETVVYLSICALAIAFKEPKSSYKKLFEELRLRGVYLFLEPLVNTIDFIKGVFVFICRKVGEMVGNISSMFGYTALFVPFALTFSDIISSNLITFESITTAFTNDFSGKLLSTVIGVGTFTVKHLVITLVDKLKNFAHKGIDKVEKVLSKFKDVDPKDIIPDTKISKVEIEDIKTFSQFKDDEIIQEKD